MTVFLIAFTFFFKCQIQNSKHKKVKTSKKKEYQNIPMQLLYSSMTHKGINKNNVLWH